MQVPKQDKEPGLVWSSPRGEERWLKHLPQLSPRGGLRLVVLVSNLMWRGNRVRNNDELSKWHEQAASTKVEVHKGDGEIT